MSETIEELVDRLAKLTAGAHYVDLLVRRNGKDELHQADFLRRLPDACRRLPELLELAWNQSRREALEQAALVAVSHRWGMRHEPGEIIARDIRALVNR